MLLKICPGWLQNTFSFRLQKTKELKLVFTVTMCMAVMQYSSCFQQADYFDAIK